MLLVVLIIYGGLFHYLAMGLPGVPYGQHKVHPVAWRQLGEDVRGVEAAIETLSGAKPLVVGMDKYNLASELAFYRRREGEGVTGAVANTASRNLFGGGALMYEIWSPPGAYSGRTLILVSFKPEKLSDEVIGDAAGPLGPVVERRVTKLGVAAGHYYYRIVEDYPGAPPIR
jgi:dolichol-phosphate mannosyltransferase